ncbi:MAG: hypothetical protein HY042_11175 [Spirochaetia bacterium]|nr:hypothetical protein [Spirochaetia bacterium]
MIADKVIAQALKGDMAAVREIADRSEGKPGNKVHYAKDYGWIDMTCLTMEQLEKIAAGEDPDLVVRDDAHA